MGILRMLQRRRARRAFGKYLSPEVIQTVLRVPHPRRHENGHRLAGYVAYSETLNPDGRVRRLPGLEEIASELRTIAVCPSGRNDDGINRVCLSCPRLAKFA
jgi:hypothetical protein